MNKVIVIGCPGSGKSTFSLALQKKTGLPVYHLDKLYWNVDRTTIDKTVFHSRLADVLQREAWIIDGNYSATMQTRMDVCDTVFFLDYPLEICLQGVAGRRGKPRPDMPWVEDPDSHDEEFLSFVHSYPAEVRPTVLKLLKQYSHKQIFIFQSRSEASAFLERLPLRPEALNEEETL